MTSQLITQVMYEQSVRDAVINSLEMLLPQFHSFLQASILIMNEEHIVAETLPKPGGGKEEGQT